MTEKEGLFGKEDLVGTEVSAARAGKPLTETQVIERCLQLEEEVKYLKAELERTRALRDQQQLIEELFMSFNKWVPRLREARGK